MLKSPFALVSGRIVLSGASGMLGKALRHRLLVAGHNVVQLVRRPASGPGEIEWNPEQAPAGGLASVLEGAAAVIHLSGANIAAARWTEARRRELLESRVQSTRVLAETLARLKQPPHTLLLASAIGFYGDRGETLLDETAPAGLGFLPDLCRQWEAAACPAAAAGVRVLPLRTGIVLASEDGALARMLPLFRLGLGGRLGSGRQWMSWIALFDLVEAVLFLLETPSVAGPVNLTAPNPVTNAQFTRALARQLHRPAFLPVPAFALRLATGKMADELLLSSARVYPARLSGAGFHFAYPTLPMALQALLV